ncbi:protein kinase, putative [Plasmodium gallinaceum]|uniref:Protein kinase, putative n=1 Tax=Plasmodium gallinaceum TaxID=5849 RepID=A0A1J1GRV5_PLAGA|nr:protein kinase, putative [Plasmodium gallinaceum]CRG95232.1 protein kinase, putative [Plasmodium gallinaceum]
MRIKNVVNNSNNIFNFFCTESETNILKDFVHIITLRENKKKKICYSYSIVDGYKYRIVIKKKKDYLNNLKLLILPLDHPNIIKLIHYCELASSFICVFEFFTDTSLYSSVVFSARYDERKIKNIIYQIILIVNYLHSNNLALKKLSPYSFLVKSVNKEVMIKLEDIYKITTISTKTNSKIKSKNVYSIGVIMYFLVCGEFPFSYLENNQKKIFFDKKLWKNISYKGRNFIKKILLNDLSSMITVKEALDHEWFKEDIKQNIYINFDILKNIYDFWKKNTFKRYILNNIAKFLIKEDIYNYNYIFSYFDMTKEGSIKYEQYFIIMKKLDLADANIQLSFNGLDISKAGLIQFSNIIASLLNSFIKIDKKIVLKFFKKVDHNNEGVLTKRKLYRFFNIKTKNEINLNDKKKFTFEEFYDYICKE